MRSSCEKDGRGVELRNGSAASGQVLFEYSALLVLALILVLALLALYTGVSDHGYRLVRLVGWNIP